MAEKLAEQLFSGRECVIATHNDTDTLHTHIIVNAVSFETDKKLHMNNAAYRHSKDLANELGAEMGLSTMDWRTKTKEKRERSKSGEAITAEGKCLSSAERNMAKNGNLNKDSWKEALRHAIDEAKAHCADRTDFQQYLYDTFGVTMTRNTGKTVTFVHPAVGETYAVRGNKLGDDYTAVSIDQALLQNKNYKDRSVLDEGFFVAEEYTATTEPSSTWADPTTTAPIPHNPTIPSQRQHQAEHGKRTTPRSISDISAELRSLDEGVSRIAKGVQGRSVDTNIRDDEPVWQVRTEFDTVYGATGRTDRETPSKPAKPIRELQQEPPKPTPNPPEHERSIQQKPKRRSNQNSR